MMSTGLQIGVACMAAVRGSATTASSLERWCDDERERLGDVGQNFRRVSVATCRRALDWGVEVGLLRQNMLGAAIYKASPRIPRAQIGRYAELAERCLVLAESRVLAYRRLVELSCTSMHSTTRGNRGIMLVDREWHESRLLTCERVAEEWASRLTEANRRLRARQATRDRRMLTACTSHTSAPHCPPS